MENRRDCDKRADKKRKRRTITRASNPTEAKQWDSDDCRWSTRPERQYGGVQTGGRLQQPQQIGDEAAVNTAQTAIVMPLVLPAVRGIPPIDISGAGIHLPQEIALSMDTSPTDVAAYGTMPGNPSPFRQPPQPLILAHPNNSNNSLGNLMHQHFQRQQRIAAIAARQSVSRSLPSNDPFIMSSVASLQNDAIRLESLNPFVANASSTQFTSVPATDLSRLAAQVAALPAGILLSNLQQLPSMNSFASLESQGQNPRPVATLNAHYGPAMAPSMLSASVPLPADARLLPPPRPPPRLSTGVGQQPFVRTAELYMAGSDDEILSDHQILLRRQIEFFEALPKDIRSFTPGRRKEISVGQVGIRCKHCAAVLEPHERTKGSMYFPSTLRALYQAAQNMGTVHFLDKCQYIDPEVRAQLRAYKEEKTTAGYGGKKYWAERAIRRGICETEVGLRFRNDVS